MNYEGFWYSKSEPHFSMPVPNVLTQEEADIIFTKMWVVYYNSSW